MQVHPINNKQCNPNFSGKLLHTNALEEFKSGLNDAQKKIYDEHVARIEKIKDGRVFKFDNVEGTDTVAIYEKINHPMAKKWVTLAQAPKEKAAWCFDELNNIYRNIIIARFDEYMNKMGK